MGNIIVTALIAGAITALANGIFAPDGALFVAVGGVINNIVSTLQGIAV